MSEKFSEQGPPPPPVHPLWIRWTHWINFPLLTLMLVSGFFIYWANPVYTTFLPDSFYSFFHLDHHLAIGLAIHFAFMWVFLINGLSYVTFLLLSGQWRSIVPRLADLRKSFQVVLADLGLGAMPGINGKYNAAQRVAYFLILLMSAASIITGAAIYKPVQLTWLRHLLLGYSASRLIHFLLAVGFFLFFFIHVGQVIKAGWNKFTAMIIGQEPPENGEDAATIEAWAASADGVKFKRLKRRGFLVAAVSALGGILGLGWIFTRQTRNGIPGPLRTALRVDEKITKPLFRESNIDFEAETPAAGTEPRINGDIGLEDEVNEDLWRLTVMPTSDAQAKGAQAKFLSLEELKGFPVTRTQTEFRCVEGWSRLLNYEGTRFSDFLTITKSGTKSGIPYHSGTPRADLYDYVALETPDGKYYVSLDIESMLHPQTILTWKMNDEPISADNGAPLRLIVPVKYGIKNLKRVGKIAFSDSRPRDYWAERGYDWYSGL